MSTPSWIIRDPSTSEIVNPPASPLSSAAFFLESPLLSDENVSENLPDYRQNQNTLDPELFFNNLDISGTPIKFENKGNSNFFGHREGFSSNINNGHSSMFSIDPFPSNNANYQYQQQGTSIDSSPLVNEPLLLDSSLSSPVSSDSKSFVKISIQPEKYQVVNYNIHPAPQLEFVSLFNEPVTIQAFLLYENNLEIKEGFTNGDVQVLKVGTSKVAFPALHLNRMIPIKNAIQQSGSMSSFNMNKDSYPYSIKFKIGELTLITQSFKLVSACNQIPDGVDVRPRKNKSKSNKDQMDVTSPPAPSTFPTATTTTTTTPTSIGNSIAFSNISTTNNSSKLVSSKSNSNSSKRRAVNEVVQDEEIYLHVKVGGESTHRGFITLSRESTLTDARNEISKSSNYPKNFRFWFEKMACLVQLHQEDTIKANEAVVDATCLIIEPYDPIMQDIDDQVLNLWISTTSKKEHKEPLVSILDVIRRVFEIYGKEQIKGVNTQADVNIISEGINNFLTNITKNKDIPGLVSLEDFKLFLKFFGPARQCLSKVFDVYREPCFHGFARHSDACEALKGKPGHFIIRFSESQLKDGFYAFNINRGNSYKDIIENYSLRYHADIGAFVFRTKRYNSLREFIQDPEYGNILRSPLSKTTVESVKQSNYRNDTEFLHTSQNR